MRRLWLVFAQAVTVCLAGFFIVATLRPQWLGAPLPAVRPAAPVARPVPVSPPPALPAQAPLSYAQAVASAAPAVVNVYTSKHLDGNVSPFQDPELNRLFRELPDLIERRPNTNLGSGVIVHEDGFVLTNYHVIEAADAIEIALADGRQSRARLIGADPESDLAVLKVDLPDLTAIAARSSADLRVGDVVLAIGNPFGVGQTTTMGIVSGLGRNRLGINIYENFIQTDAAINPGNSGGALVDALGRLVGINTAIYSETGGSLGIGFAIPATTALAIMDEIVRTGAVTRGWLGMEPQDITPDLLQAFGLNSEEGVIIASLQHQGPGDQAGMRVGDIVLRFNGQTVTDSIGLLNQIAPIKPGQAVTLSVLRDGKPLELTVRVGARPVARHR
ncbi:MAG TPA: trypsin-like peptidase domain-containing protein [Alcaligenes sp.]|nr:trypsin-like peptidase domain-containing protein [Alcaligenes sp.]HRL26051.1 trypsin-like peptidase domain-containing protein [Alcaligenes sp.]